MLNVDTAVSANRTSLKKLLPLSGDLRARTATLHEQAEFLLGLPDSIASRREYADWLGHFLAFYDPLERAIDAFSGGEVFEPFLSGSFQTQRLLRDLGGLGYDRRVLMNIPRAPRPAIQSFAHALGARYVLKGSALGGKVILRSLEARIGPQIVGATAFFGGDGSSPASSWRAFKEMVDHYGEGHPECREDVLIGAEATFSGLLDWFEPFVFQERRLSLSATPVGGIS